MVAWGWEGGREVWITKGREETFGGDGYFFTLIRLMLFWIYIFVEAH